MTVCAVKWCHNKSEKQKKDSNITFHRFPSDPSVAIRWIEKLRLNRNEESWIPTKNTRICSIHFSDSDKYFSKGGLCKLLPNAVPSKELHIACSRQYISHHYKRNNDLPLLHEMNAYFPIRQIQNLKSLSRISE